MSTTRPFPTAMPRFLSFAATAAQRGGLLAAVLVSAACSETGLASKGGSEVATEDSDFAYSFEGLRLDFVPTELPASIEDVVLLPQSQFLPTIDSAQPFEVGPVDLEEPLNVGGRVTAPDRPAVLPAAELPGTTDIVGLPATVRIAEAGSLHDYRGVSDDDGNLAMFVMPGDQYQVTVVPDDPRQPLTSFPWRSGEALDLDLATGQSIFGRVLVGGVPLGEAGVQLIDDRGVASSTAITDDNGFYELRAQPGTYTVRSLGRSFKEEPVLSIDGVDLIDGSATRLDVEYPPLVGALVEARIVDVDGDPLSDVTVRFEALALDGLEGLPATFAVDKTTDDVGGILARLPAGTYDVLVLPEAGSDGARHTPTRIAAVDLSTDDDLGMIELEGSTTVQGTVADGNASRLPGAVVACREQAYGRRSWTTVSDDEGRFVLDLPKVPITCAVSPPADRTNLALTRSSFDPGDNASPTLRLGAGVPVSGVVQRDGEPEALVVVEIRDATGDLQGSALSDEEGRWQIQLPRP